jgi:hypothetical protein
MRTLRLLLGLATAAIVAGCGGSSAPPAGQVLAQQACQSSGSPAADLAARAAQQNATYATLAADEAAYAQQQATQAQSVMDGNPADDSSIGALTAQTGLGTASGQRVLAECVRLGLRVTTSH